MFAKKIPLSLLLSFWIPFVLIGCQQSSERAAATAVSEKPKLKVGEPFPNIVLPSLRDGRPLSLADFRGRKIILHVFASW